jgi:hypothetical protein
VNIQTVIDNLSRTIDGKNQFLAALEREGSTFNLGIAKIVRLNIEELERIKADLEACQVKWKVECWYQYKIGNGPFEHNPTRDVYFTTEEKANEYARNADSGFSGDTRFRYKVVPA